MGKITWRFQLEDGIHVVDLDHSPVTGKTTVLLDGAVIIATGMTLEGNPDTQKHEFSIKNHICVLEIKKSIISSLRFNYNLRINENSLPPAKPNDPPVVLARPPLGGSVEGQAIAPTGYWRDSALDNKAQLAQAQIASKAKLHRQVIVSSNWMFAIAGLTLLNLILGLLHINLIFNIGLAISQLVEEFAADLSNSGLILTFTVDGILIGAFAVLAFHAQQRKSWAFIGGLVIYGLDTLLLGGIILLLLSKNSTGQIDMRSGLFSGAFHLIALFQIYSGIDSNKTLERIEQNEQVRAEPIT